MITTRRATPIHNHQWLSRALMEALMIEAAGALRDSARRGVTFRSHGRLFMSHLVQREDQKFH